MTEAEARQTIAQITAVFVAEPYDIVRDIELKCEDDENFLAAKEVLGEDWHYEMNSTVIATAGGDSKAEV